MTVMIPPTSDVELPIPSVNNIRKNNTANSCKSKNSTIINKTDTKFDKFA